MPKINEDNLYEDLEFSCKVCGQKAMKSSALENEYGYISKVDGSWVGPLCDKCAKNNKPGYPILTKSVPESMFVVVIQQDGGGAVALDYDDASEIKLYKRQATPQEIINACQNVVDNTKLSKLMSLLNGAKRKG